MPNGDGFPENTTTRLGSLLSTANIAVLLLDTKMRIRRFTPAVKDLLELMPSDVGRPLCDLTKHFDDPDLPADCQAVLDQLIPIERDVQSTSGRDYLRRVHPYRTTDNRITGVVVTFVDITAIKSAQEALRRSEERFRLVVEGSPDFAILLLDPRGNIVTWSVGAERMLGYAAAEAIGKSAAMICPRESAIEHLQRQMQHAAEFGRAVDQSWHVRKSGARLWGSGVLTAVRDDDGELTGFVKVLRDETARKRAETERAELLILEQAARREAEKANSHKDQFLATVSHELRTPLSAILLWAKMLRQGVLTEDEQREAYEAIERSADSQRQLLDDLLETSRITSGKVRLEPTEVELPEIMRMAVERIMPMAREKGVAIECQLADDLPPMIVDPERIGQVVNNLLTNAVKFTPSGGRVRLELSRRGDWAELQVTDTGQGIDPEFLPHVFTPFSQAEPGSRRSHGGLGLGLAICQELVDLHGGTIHAESPGRGEGATFLVRLPLSSIDQPRIYRSRKPAAEPTNVDGLHGAHVLLVEDEPQTCEVLRKVLDKGGAQVTATGTVEGALAVVESARPDIIISDIALPEEDGYQLLQRIRARETERNEPPIPAIALTAFAGRNDRRQAREAGFHLHLAKPVDSTTLINAVARLLAESRSANK